MNAILDRIRQRFEELRQQRRAELTPHRMNSQPGVRGAAGTLLASGRVFDTVSGLEGDIIARTTENLIVPPARRTDG